MKLVVELKSGASVKSIGDSLIVNGVLSHVVEDRKEVLHYEPIGRNDPRKNGSFVEPGTLNMYPRALEFLGEVGDCSNQMLRDFMKNVVGSRDSTVIYKVKKKFKSILEKGDKPGTFRITEKAKADGWPQIKEILK